MNHNEPMSPEKLYALATTTVAYCSNRLMQDAHKFRQFEHVSKLMEIMNHEIIDALFRFQRDCFPEGFKE